MKLTLILTLTAVLNVSAKGISQTVSFNAKNASIQEVFTAIEKQTGFTVVYNATLLDKAKPVFLAVTDVPLREFLQQALKGQQLEFSIKNTTIFISSSSSRSSSHVDNNFLPPGIIKVRVTNADGQPLEGASILIKNSKNSGVTSAEGVFSLNVTEGDVLVISFVGYQTKEVKITPSLTASGVLVVSLEQDVSNLNEVVINKGYYTEKQKLSAGNVGRVTSVEIEKQPVSNPLLALEGRVSGVMITQTSGVPGSSVNVQIRGQKSIAWGNDPLYLIDGVVYSSQLLPGVGSSIIGTGNPLNYINPLDIETIEILKDADAASIYGSRGANGVILITTKKGKTGPPKVNVNFYQGIGKAPMSLEMMKTRQYLEMRREAFKNDNVIISPTRYDVNGVWDSTRYTNWQEELIGGTAHYTNVQGSLSGGDMNNQYLIDLGYRRETTVFPGDYSDNRGSIHIKLSSQSNNQKFKSTFNANYLLDNNNLFYYDLANLLTVIAPDAPKVYTTNGQLNNANNTFANPLASQLAGYKNLNNNLIANLVLSYAITKALGLKVNSGLTNMNVNEKRLFPVSYYAASNLSFITTGDASFSSNNIRSWLVEPQIDVQSVQKRFGSIKATIGATFQKQISDGQILNGTGYTNDALLSSLQAAASISKGTISSSQYKYDALFGRIGYNYSDKYILNLTARRDGSSRFGPSNRFSNFGSLAGAWVFSNEKYFKQYLSFISYGKLRASYGSYGNDQIGDYKYLELYNFTGNNSYQGGTGLYPNNIFSPDYRWELNKNFEIGLELGFIKDRARVSISKYRNRSSNQLVGYTLPDITGFTSITANLPATVENRGWEFEINTLTVNKNNFSWSTSINFSIPRNELIEFPNLVNSVYSTSLVIGKPISIKKVFQFGGVDPQTGVYQFLDYKGNMTSNPSYSTDLISFVDLSPKYFGGFQNNFNYKGLQLNFLFQFVKQMGLNYSFIPSVPAGWNNNNRLVENLQRWQKPGDISLYQRFTQTSSSSAYSAYQFARASNFAFSDASFIRLKNLSISYSIPRTLIKKSVQNLRVYLQGQNLITFTNYTGIDPENNSAALPPLKVITIGFQVGL